LSHNYLNIENDQHGFKEFSFEDRLSSGASSAETLRVFTKQKTTTTTPKKNTTKKKAQPKKKQGESFYDALNMQLNKRRTKEDNKDSHD